MEKIKKTVTTDEKVKTRDRKTGKPTWEKPTLEDVSKKVMAQPYIRFT